jgi:hypothetical protein
MTSEDGIVRAVARWAWRMNSRRSRECQPLVFARACHGVGSCTTFRAGTQIEHAGDVAQTKKCKSISSIRSASHIFRYFYFRKRGPVLVVKYLIRARPRHVRAESRSARAARACRAHARSAPRPPIHRRPRGAVAGLRWSAGGRERATPQTRLHCLAQRHGTAAPRSRGTRRSTAGAPGRKRHQATTPGQCDDRTNVANSIRPFAFEACAAFTRTQS